MDNSYSFGKTIAALQLDRMNIQLTQGEGGPFDERALDALKTRNLALVTGITDDMSKTMVTQISEGMIAGESVNDIARRIDGTSVSFSPRAETIARTETAFAVNTGTMNRYREEGTESVMVIAALDDRTCDICAPLDMQVFSISDAPTLPEHPNCRCTFAAVPPDGTEFEPFTDEEINDFRDGNFTPLFRNEVELGPEPVVITPEPVSDKFVPFDLVSEEGVKEFRNSNVFTDIYNGLSNGELEESSYYQDIGLARLFNENGFDGLPKLVEEAEFDRLAETGDYEIIHRGVREEAFVEQFKTGDLFVGKGVYGDGSYFSTDYKLAERHTGFGSGLESDPKKVITALVPKDIKTQFLEDSGVKTQLSELTIHLRDLNLNNDPIFEKTANSVLDPSFISANGGIQMIKTHEEYGKTFRVILDRRVLIIKR